MSSTVDTIKEKLSIVDVVSSYVKLDQNGSNFKARCPFHNEKTPSFFVSPDRGGYYCFGCNKKGDMFTFIEDFEGVDFKGALKILADKAGVDITYDSKLNDKKDILFKIMEVAQNYFIETIAKNKEVIDYLVGRGLTEDTIEKFKIGYVSNEWQSLYEYLRSKKFLDVDIEAVGLIKRGESGRYYDRFRGRIMFPINDSSGRVVAFTGRIYIDDGKSAKYLNSPETELFLKSKVLYGLDRAKFDIKRLNYAILVEGQTDLIMSHQAGFTNTVASSGTAITVDGLTILSRLSSNIMIAFDKDSAGISAARRAAAISAFTLDMIVKVVTVPDGKDPADAILTSVDLWKEALRNSQDIIVFELEHIVSTKPKNTWMKEIYDHVFPYLAVFPSEMKIDNYIRVITEHTGFSPDSVRGDFNTYSKNHKDDVAQKKNQSTFKIEKNNYFSLIEKKLYGFSRYLKDKNTQTSLYEKVCSELTRVVPPDRLKELERLPEEELNTLLFEIELTTHLDTMNKEIDELVLGLEEEQILKQFSEKQQALRRAEASNNQIESEQLVKECNELLKKISEIKKRRAYPL